MAMGVEHENKNDFVVLSPDGTTSAPMPHGEAVATAAALDALDGVEEDGEGSHNHLVVPYTHDWRL